MRFRRKSCSERGERYRPSPTSCTRCGRNYSKQSTAASFTPLSLSHGEYSRMEECPTFGVTFRLEVSQLRHQLRRQRTSAATSAAATPATEHDGAVAAGSREPGLAVGAKRKAEEAALAERPSVEAVVAPASAVAAEDEAAAVSPSAKV